jgi:hypothetical protein
MNKFKKYLLQFRARLASWVLRKSSSIEKIIRLWADQEILTPGEIVLREMEAVEREKNQVKMVTLDVPPLERPSPSIEAVSQPEPKIEIPGPVPEWAKPEKIVYDPIGKPKTCAFKNGDKITVNSGATDRDIQNLFRENAQQSLRNPLPGERKHQNPYDEAERFNPKLTRAYSKYNCSENKCEEPTATTSQN